MTEKTCSACKRRLCDDNKSGLCFEHIKAQALARRDALREKVEALFVEEGLPFKEIARRLGISVRYTRELTDLRRLHTPTKSGGNPVIADIIAVTSETLAVPVDRIMSHVRVKRFANARQIAWLISRERGYSLPDIGRATRRDHSTVLSGIRSISEKAARDPALTARIDMVRRRARTAQPGFVDRLQAADTIRSATRPEEMLPADQAAHNVEMAISSRRLLSALRMTA